MRPWIVRHSPLPSLRRLCAEFGPGGTYDDRATQSLTHMVGGLRDEQQAHWGWGVGLRGLGRVWAVAAPAARGRELPRRRRELRQVRGNFSVQQQVTRRRAAWHWGWAAWAWPRVRRGWLDPGQCRRVGMHATDIHRWSARALTGWPAGRLPCCLAASRLVSPARARALWKAHGTPAS